MEKLIHCAGRILNLEHLTMAKWMEGGDILRVLLDSSTRLQYIDIPLSSGAQFLWNYIRSWYPVVTLSNLTAYDFEQDVIINPKNIVLASWETEEHLRVEFHIPHSYDYSGNIRTINHIPAEKGGNTVWKYLLERSLCLGQ